ncbi:coiled-coil domain-containing protein 112-like [Chiloscyllium plagiosum]|uniref:coiled-coil domain-containing protein 112-like n=1 Tax=Chiloscyllium plagiosum TaxID=36176 RepID=UPI001CB7E3EA|nr:coiled-coil domain-containing protein 112-like [Chiloscyllium plagiosum]
MLRLRTPSTLLTKMATIVTATMAGDCGRKPDSVLGQRLQVLIPERRDSGRKAAFSRELRKLWLQIANLEKDKNAHLFNKRNEFRAEYSTLEELELKLTNNRKTEKMKVQQRLAKIRHNVKRFQSQLMDVKPTPEFIEKLKEIMEEVENAISIFKEEQRQMYEELLKEEKATTQEISAVEKKMEVWALIPLEAVIPKSAIAKGISTNSGPDNVLVEITELDKYLQQTGRQGGWDDFDHQEFLKVWTRHKGKASFIEEALQHLVGRTREDVMQHVQWYQEFLFLEERQKEAIQKWKTKKQNEKMKLLKMQTEAEEKTNAERLAKEKAKRLRLEKERKEREAQLQLWKKQKELEFALEKEQQMKEEAEKMKRQRKDSQRRLEIKRMLKDFTEQKKEKEEFLQLEAQMREEAEREERQWLVTKEISRFQDRDFQKLESKLAEKRMKQEKKDEQEKRLAKLKEKIDAQIQRDPSRLLKPTKGWEQHIKETGQNGGVPMLFLPHRAIPSWRQGI